MEFHTGDQVEVPSNKVEVPPRRGTVERVIQDDPAKLEIRWEDGHSSILQPHAGALRLVENR